MSAMLREAGLLKKLAAAEKRIQELEQEVSAHRDNEESFADELQSVSTVPAARSVPGYIRVTANDLLDCFKAWEPDVRVLGNVRAGAAAEALSYLLAAAPVSKKDTSHD